MAALFVAVLMTLVAENTAENRLEYKKKYISNRSID